MQLHNDKITTLQTAIQTAYLDHTINSNLAYRPEFISNNYKLGKKVLVSIEEELQRCEEFFISVAFITKSGITPLLQTLKDLEQKNIPGKILTTNYLMFSEPEALEKLAGLAGVHRIKIHALRHSHVALLISMGVNPLIIKDRLGHEKIQTTLGTYGHLYPNSNFEVAKMLGGVINFTPATESVADYTHNQFTASYHRQM